MRRLRAPLERAIADARLHPDDLDAVILVGGATRMPLVRSMVARLFQKMPLVHLDPDTTIALGAAVQAAIIGLMINESAYIAEIIRAGLDSVPKGQFEAAASLGMKPAKVMRWIIVPQALRVMVPPLGNSFNGLMKTTSVLSVIGVSEMFLVTQSISSATFHTFEIFIVAAIYYLALTTIWTFIQANLENRLARQLGIEQRVPLTQRLLGARRPAAAALEPVG